MASARIKRPHNHGDEAPSRRYRAAFGAAWLIGIATGPISGPATAANEDVARASHMIRLALPALGFGLTLWHSDQPGRYQFYKSFGSTIAATYTLKHLVDEKRPESKDHDAFPSGHTAAAFSGASFIQRRYGWQTGAPAYALASFVGYARVRNDAHYVHDTLAGAALATGFTYLFTSPMEVPRMAASPMTGTDRVGLRISGRF